MKFEEYFTERLILRKLEPGDFRFIFEHYPEAEIRNLLGIHSDAEYEKELNKYRNGYSTHNRSFVFFQMIDRVTGIMIGGGGFHNWCTDHFRAELGYAISDEDYKEKGLMTEALAFIIEYGFTKMNLHRVEAFISPQNIPSLKLIAKYDFTKEGCLRQHYYKDDKMEDSLVFSLLKTEYPQRAKNCD